MSLRILIVDDNRELAENLGEILADVGYDVRIVSDPCEAVEEPSMAFDVGILDVRMPSMDGMSLHAKLAAQHPHALFFLMTAYIPDDRLAEAMRAGVRRVLPKPVPIAELLAELPPPESVRDVLVIEEDAEIGPMLTADLAANGYLARWVRSVAGARQAIDESRPDAVVADLSLPDGDGISLALQMCIDLALPVVLMTRLDSAQADEVVRQIYGDRGRILTKPFSTEHLLKALEQVAQGKL